MIGPRYLALVRTGGHAPSCAELSAITGLPIIFDGPRLSVLSDDPYACLQLDPGRGMIVGTLFARGAGNGRIAALAPRDQVEIRRSRGTWLMAHVWGGYVAFLLADQTNSVDIVRDPGGALPAYIFHVSPGTYIASDVDLLIAVGLQPAIDYDFLAGHLRLPQMRTARTGLIGLRELLPGTRLACSPMHQWIDTLWSPWIYAAPEQRYRSFEEACSAVREEVLRCIACWASLPGPILLGVSGGLDSSIVAAGLQACGAAYSLYTLVTADPIGDERRYARALADHLGVELIECEERPDFVDIRHSEAGHLPRPLARAFAQSGNRHGRDLAAKLGARAFFSGGGGDSVFCYLTSTAPIVDRLRTEGVFGGWWKSALDVSRLTNVGLPRVMMTLLPKLTTRDASYRWTFDDRFLREYKDASPAGLTDHPWSDTAPGVPRGKAAHIAWLLGIQNYLEGFAHEQHYPVIFPLMAQPVMEVCLRVPSWMWCAGGRNRAVARNAFQHLLPRAIVERRSKGSFDGLVRQILDTNLDIVRSMLLDGRLAGHRLVDCDQIARSLADPDSLSVEACANLMVLVDAEAWTDQWSNRSDAVAVAAIRGWHPLRHER